jgi:hypothetical protein
MDYHTLVRGHLDVFQRRTGLTLHEIAGRIGLPKANMLSMAKARRYGAGLPPRWIKRFSEVLALSPGEALALYRARSKEGNGLGYMDHTVVTHLQAVTVLTLRARGRTI